MAGLIYFLSKAWNQIAVKAKTKKIAAESRKLCAGLPDSFVLTSKESFNSMSHHGLLWQWLRERERACTHRVGAPQGMIKV